MRSIAVAMMSRYYQPNARFNPDRYQTMDDFLLLMARVELTDSSIFFNRTEYKEFESTPPELIGPSIREAQPPTLNPEFLKYPIGYSVAIYPNLDLPSSRTPLLWTRDLHLFRKFNEPYCGYIAYLDGHVTFYQGTPSQPDPDLLEVFNESAPSAQATRILKHVPNGWVEPAPLPIRFAFMKKETFIEKYSLIIFLLIPAITCGLLAGMFSNNEQLLSQRILSSAAVFLIVLFLTAILVPSVGC